MSTNVSSIPIQCCKKCYQHAIFISFGLVGGGEFGKFVSSDFKDKFKYVSNHSECELCRKKFDIHGYDPCDDFQFSDKLELFDYITRGIKTYPFINVFHSILSSTSVGNEGSIGQMFDYRISNWLCEVDNS